jgi:hypothetical protein
LLTTTDTEYIHKISNHPVHIVDDQNLLSPSAFIPFCSLGDDMEIIGQIVPNFTIPVCNKFKPTVLDGQRCYQLDVNQFASQVDRKLMSHGLTFLMDYNEDRMGMTNDIPNEVVQNKDLVAMQGSGDSRNEAMIYIETLGKYKYFETD